LTEGGLRSFDEARWEISAAFGLTYARAGHPVTVAFDTYPMPEIAICGKVGWPDWEPARMGRLMPGSSLNGAVVIPVSCRGRWAAQSSFFRMVPTGRVIVSLFGKIPRTSVWTNLAVDVLQRIGRVSADLSESSGTPATTEANHIAQWWPRDGSR
jgi:hypothetical protein